MKICHAYLFFSIKFAGGTSDLMFKLCRAQAKLGLNPVIYTGDYRLDHDLMSEIPSVEFKVVRSYLDKLGFSLMPGLIALARKDIPTFDIVHMHVYRTFQNLVLYYYCRKYKIPYVMDAHGSVPLYKRKNFLKKLFDKLIGKKLLRHAEYLIAETQVGVDEYKALDQTLSDEKLVILSPPFSVEEYKVLPERGRFREQYNIGADEKVIMFLGRVHSIKGNDFLIKGFAELVKSRDDCKVVIIGPDDGHMGECKQLANDLGVANRVIFTGFLGGENKNSALVDADIVVQLSRQEQGAWAPLEGVLCGTPIIVTSHTGTGEDVRRLDAGYLVDFDDIQGLANKFQYIFTHYDEAKEKTLKAKKYIEDNLSMEARMHEYTNLYESAIKKCSSSEETCIAE